MTGSTTAPKRKAGLQKGAPGPRQAHNDKFHNFKDCGKCGENKRLADFALAANWRKKRAADPKRYKNACKTCTRAGNAAELDPGFNPKRVPRTRTKNPTAEQTRERRAAYKRRVRRETRIKCLQYLADKGCCECGTHDPRILEFDHIDPDEKFRNISRLLIDGFSWGSETLRSEIRKCRVVCANCHRLHTIVQQEYYNHDDIKAALRVIYADHSIRE